MSDENALIDAFLVGASPGEVDRAALGLALEALFQRGRQGWPQVLLNETEFVTFVVERVPSVDPLSALAGMHAEDLYLVCGCLHALPAALRAFDGIFERVLGRATAKLQQTPSEVDELRQELRVRLLAPSPQGRLGHYRGTGPLEGWLRVTIVRASVSRVRGDQRSRAGRRRLAEAVPLPAAAPELAFAKQSHRDAFSRAFEASLRELPSRDRALLRMRYFDDLNIDDIARLYDVHRATAARWLAGVRSSLLEGTRQRLARELGTKSHEADSIIRALQTDLQASVVRYLQPENDANDES